MVGGTDSEVTTSLRERGDRAFEMIDERLSSVPCFAGNELTAADIMMLFPLTTMRMFAPRDLSGFPHILAYLKRIGERPAFRRATEKADPGFEPLLS
jgi:glutathione S-transferase